MQFVGRHTMLARQLFNRRETLFDLILSRSIDVETFPIVLELARSLTDLDCGSFNQRKH